MDKLGYKAHVLRPATDDDLQLVPAVCEHCHQSDDLVRRCHGCRRGFHSDGCDLQKQWQQAKRGPSSVISQFELINEDGYCWECQRFDPVLDATSDYLEQVAPWYIEWEPHFEDADTMKGLGFADLVEQTVQALSQPPAHRPQTKEPRDKHLTNRERQGNQGPRLHATIGEDCRQKCTFVTQDTDPHVDIVGTGAYVLQEREVYRRLQLSGGEKKDYHTQMVTVHDPTGRTVGMITPQRLAVLHHNYTQVMATRPDVVDKLQPRSFPEELAALVRRYKEGTPIPGTKRKVDLTNHWATPPGIYDTFQAAIPELCKERFASPLNYHPGMAMYWSAFERDQLFGAQHDAYSCRWTGFSVANPEYESKEMYKAVSWAVHSAQNSDSPTLTVFILPAWTDGSNTAYMKWVRKMPDTCRLLGSIPKRSFKFIQPQAATGGLAPEDTGHPKWDINILLVGNKVGFEALTPAGRGLTKLIELKRALIHAVNEHANPSEPLTWAKLGGHDWPDGDSLCNEECRPGETEKLDSVIYRPPAKALACMTDEGAAALAPGIDLEDLVHKAEEQLALTSNLPLKYDWRRLVYTDGSQRKIDIGPNGRQTVRLGSGVYVPGVTESEEARHIGIQSTAPTRHNTPYRAELVGILGALKEGHSSIMTDSVNSIYAIRAVMYYPAQVRYHRHKYLLEQIKTEIMTLEDHQVQLIKVKGHAGIPGNEYADDIATTVASTGQADIDMSDVESNHRPYQEWPMQKVWEEDENSESGLRERWQQVENLEDALTNRIQTKDMRLGSANTDTIYYQAMQKCVGDMAKPYIDSWSTIAGITEGMKNTRIKYLSGQLPTAKNLKRYKKRKSDICPCCNTHPDSGHHAVAWCPGIMPMVQEKHNTAVRIITKAIANGDRGADDIVYTDGGSATKWARSGAAHLHKTLSNIPADLVSKAELKAAGSRPDILLYRRKKVKRMPDGQWATSPAQITVVEVKYARDTDPSRTHRDPFDQHDRLYQMLRQQHPSAILERRSIILGTAGAVYTEATERQLKSLGVKGNLLRSCKIGRAHV